MLKVVAGALNNTPAVCRASYVHPVVIDRYLDGSLAAVWAGASRRGSPALSPDERRLVNVLSSSD